MIQLDLVADRSRPFQVLCLGAHCDDIEIGCGGTLLKLVGAHRLEVDWVVFSSDAARAAEARQSAGLFLAGAARAEVALHTFRNGYFPHVGDAIKDEFERLKQAREPDLIFTHTRDDLHQDHRVLCELTWNTFRSHLILEYEIPKYDSDLGAPNAFVGLDEATAARKVDYLLRCFATQRDKHWFTADTFLGLMRLRGVQAGPPQRFAEAFYCRKVGF